MAVKRMRLEGPCPACHEPTLDYTAAGLDIPYFRDVTQLIFACASCGFRHSDFLVGSAREPRRQTFRVSEPDHVLVRVVRSTSGTVRIPELGVLIEPGPASDAYVSNIEGVLVRVESILDQLLRDAETPADRAKCTERLKQLRAARGGRFPFTFVIEDPHGNSAIVHPEAREEAIPPEEAAHLKTGATTVHLSEAGAPDSPAGDLGPRGNGHR